MLNLLAAGWTSLRVAGGADMYYGNQDIKRLIDEGVLKGPRLFGAATSPICSLFAVSREG